MTIKELLDVAIIFLVKSDAEHEEKKKDFAVRVRCLFMDITSCPLASKHFRMNFWRASHMVLPRKASDTFSDVVTGWVDGSTSSSCIRDLVLACTSFSGS
jgi:hypothetical protein